MACLGCGDDTEPADDGGAEDVATGADADAGADAEDLVETEGETAPDDGAGTGSLTVLVVGDPLAPSREWTPRHGAAVALDLPGGGRAEATTDATGHATFGGLDWSAGTAAVTAGAEGFGLASLVGIDGSETDVTLALPNLGDPTAGWVELSVDAVNFAVATDWFDCGISVAPNEASYYIHQATPTTLPLTILAPPGVPLVVAGTEWSFLEIPGGFEQPLRPFAQPLEPLDGPGSVVIDLGTLPTPGTAAGSFVLPVRSESPLRTDISYGWVLSDVALDPARQLRPIEFAASGAPSRMARTADGNGVDYEWTWLPLPAGATPVTMFDLRDSWERTGRLSAVYVAGYPTPGAQEFTFLDVPTVLEPGSVSVRHPLHDPVVWELHESSVTPTLYVSGTRHAVDTTLWRTTAPTGATTLTVPEPPTMVDAGAILGTLPLRGRVGLVADDPGATLAKYAQTPLFTLEP